MIIAEIGWNHMGDIELAKRMIDAAIRSGCAFVKFQVWSVDNLVAGPWDTDGRRQIYEKAELSTNQLLTLKSYCESHNIGFLVSIFSTKDIAKLDPLSLSSIKIPSTEAANQSLLEWVSLYGFDRVFISFGTCTESEIKFAKNILDPDTTVAMHCVSSYPCPANIVNLNRLDFLKSSFKNVGYSGHFDGIDDALAACALGAKFIEKHFTIDKSLPGRDNKFALNESQMTQLCQSTKNISAMLSTSNNSFMEAESSMRDDYRGRWDG